MNKLFSLLYLTCFILMFIGCEYLIHTAESLAKLEKTTFIFLRIIEWVCGFGVVIEAIEIAFEIQIKKKFKDAFDKWSKGSKK